MVARHHQIGNPHYLRLQSKTKRDWRNVRWLLGLYRGPFRRVVWVSGHDLLAVGMAHSQFPGTDTFNHDFDHLWYTLMGIQA